MNVLSLFDGMSCGQIALSKLGLTVDKYFASEIKPHAIKVTQSNFPNTIQLGDVTKIKASVLPKIYLLIGGSPCQDFSRAHRDRKGLDGIKSGLFYEYLRLLRETKAKYFFLENVKMNKRDAEIISYELGVEPITINSKDVCGQLRQRSYWTNIPFNGIETNDAELQSVLTNGYTDRTKSRCLLESDSRPPSTPVKMFHRYYSTGFTTLVFKDKKHYEDCKAHYDNNFKNLSAKEIDVKLASVQGTEVYDGVRYLNQHELEKLQTVPSGYTDVISRNKAASLLGDGWTIDVVSQFLGGLCA